MAGKTANRDLNSLVMQRQMQSGFYTTATLVFFITLLLTHVGVAYFLKLKGLQKLKPFLKIKKKLWTQLLSVASFALINERIGFIPWLVLGIVVLSCIGTHLLCLLEDKRDGFEMKVAVSVSQGSVIAFWVFFWPWLYFQY